MRKNARRTLGGILAALLLFATLSCSSKADPETLVMIIESSPTNLDPRVGLDAYSERIDDLIFDDLLTRDDHLNVQPGLAERWEIPDPRTYVFHLHRGVKFHDGRPLTSRDVKWTFDSLLQGKIRSTKSGAYRLVDRIDAPDDSTVVFYLKEPFATLLWNLSDGAIGIVKVVHAENELLEVIRALRPPRRLPCRLHRRQEERHKRSDDCNHD